MRHQTCLLLALSIAGSVFACTSSSSTTNPATTDGADGSVEPSDNDGGDETTTDGGTGGGKDSTGPDTQYKRVFITSARYSGDLKTAGNAADGLAGADKLCMAAATGAALGGTWKAFISGKVGSSTVNAPDRIAGSGPWLLVSGDFVAFETRGELSTGSPHGPLDMDETGKRVGAEVVWTGTKQGAYLSPACELAGNSWESADFGTDGGYGAPTETAGGSWANFGTNHCGLTAHLYCFEQ